MLCLCNIEGDILRLEKWMILLILILSHSISGIAVYLYMTNRPIERTTFSLSFNFQDGAMFTYKGLEYHMTDFVVSDYSARDVLIVRDIESPSSWSGNLYDIEMFYWTHDSIVPAEIDELRIVIKPVFVDNWNAPVRIKLGTLLTPEQMIQYGIYGTWTLTFELLHYQ